MEITELHLKDGLDRGKNGGEGEDGIGGSVPAAAAAGGRRRRRTRGRGHRMLLSLMGEGRGWRQTLAAKRTSAAARWSNLCRRRRSRWPASWLVRSRWPVLPLEHCVAFPRRGRDDAAK